MRHGHALLAGLLSALAAGCTTPGVQSMSWWERFRPFQGPTGPDVVLIDVALIECPLGDPYLKDELWRALDEQVVALEHRAILEENGLRLGQLAGILPARLQTLLTSEKSCANPRQIQLRAGNSKSLEIGPVHPVCRFQLHQAGQTLPVSLEQAVSTFQVQPSLTRGGRTRLHITPVLRHGEAKLTAQPAPDRSRWEFLQQHSTETYSALAWEVTLAPNEYLILSARADRPQTLGHRYFVREDEPVPVQRLLVLRTNRPNAPDLTIADEEEPAKKRSPSLAAQAVWSAGPANKP